MNKDSAKLKLQEILKDSISSIRFENVTNVYFVNSKTMDKVLNLYEETENLRSKRTKKLWPFGKIISKDSPMITYSLYMQAKYVTISSNDKILEYLPVKFLVFSAITKKNAQDYISNYQIKENFSNEDREIEMKRIKKKAADEISAAKERVDYIINNIKKLKVVITGIETSKPYPSIYYNTNSGTNKNEHLRIDVPNIILVHPNFYQSERRRDAAIFKFVQEEATLKAFPQVYYQEM